MHGLEDEYGDRLTFSYLDIDDPNTQPFKDALKYRVQPHLFLLDVDGHVVKQWLGRVTREEFVSAFQSVLQ